MSRALDLAWQVSLRCGFILARSWWRIRHPGHRGAIIAVWHDGRLLCVQQSYRRGLAWPGGGVHPGEEPVKAAQRELQEELGLLLPTNSFKHVYRLTREWDYRRDDVDIFEVVLEAAPQLRIDNREIIATRFLCPDEVSKLSDSPFIAAYLDRFVFGTARRETSVAPVSDTCNC